MIISKRGISVKGKFLKPSIDAQETAKIRKQLAEAGSI
jgi:hypothetical protein